MSHLLTMISYRAQGSVAQVGEVLSPIQVIFRYIIVPILIAGFISLATFALTAPRKKSGESPITHIE